MALSLVIAGHACAEDDLHYLEATSVLSDTSLEDGTWVVNGSIAVEGATLSLENATLFFNATDREELRIGTDARLECNRSGIRGTDKFTRILVEGEANVTTTLIGKTFVDAIDRRIWVGGGSLALNDAWVCGWSVYCGGNLTIVDSTVSARESSVVCYDWSSDRPLTYDVDIVGSLLESRLWWSRTLSFQDPDDARLECRVRIDGCTVKNLNGVGFGMEFEDLGADDLVSVTNTTITGHYMGIRMSNVRAPTVLSGLVIQGDVGLTLLSCSFDSLQVDNVSVKATYLGMRVDRQGGTLNASRCQIASGDVGLHCFGTDLNMVDSGIFGKTTDLKLEWFSNVRLLDCDHGLVVDRRPGCSLAAASVVHIEGTRWEGGPELVEGTLRFVGGDGRDLGTMRVEDQPGTIEIVYWRIDSTVSRMTSWVFGVYLDRLEPFRSLGFPPSRGQSLEIRLVDHWVPEILTLSIEEGSCHNTSMIGLHGFVVERGAGMASVTGRLGDGPWAVGTLGPSGRFDLSVESPSDGVHTLEVVARDRTGLTGTLEVEGIVVDTVPPTIEVLSPGHVVNGTPVEFEVLTEVDAEVYVDNRPTSYNWGGLYTRTVHVPRGMSSLLIWVRDRAGNVNHTWFPIELDDVPPLLVVDYPVEGECLCARRFLVRGVSETGSAITIDGQPADRNGPVFSLQVVADEGRNTIRIVSQDLAGNVRWMTVNFTVDTRPPLLAVHDPVDNLVTADTRLRVSGVVLDDTPVRVTVDGHEVAVADGEWEHLFELDGSVHVIEFVAKDAAGNVAFAHRTVFYDCLPPKASVRLTIEGREYEDPAVPIRTRCTDVTVSVVTYEVCRVDIEDFGLWWTGKGVSRLEIALSGDSETSISIVVSDALGNRREPVVFNVTVDWTPPTLVITRPDINSVMSKSPVVVMGHADPGSRVYVHGERVQLSGMGSFQSRLYFSSGSNHFEVVATDDVGNQARTYLSVYCPLGGEQVEAMVWDSPALAIFLFCLVCILGTLLVMRAMGW